jgi:hypothetical protein
MPITTNTYIDDDGCVHFCRRLIEDLWIASHIPELIDELDCHIFVDITFTVTVFMYLYKYMFKGPDRSFFYIPHPHELSDPSEPINEIKDYIDGHYLIAPEAAWCILGFHLTNKVPSVRSLSIHLSGENIPQFLKEESASSLIHYFHRPPQPLFDMLNYIQYNQEYVSYHYIENEIHKDKVDLILRASNLFPQAQVNCFIYDAY